jgi:hypothetical protein
MNSHSLFGLLLILSLCPEAPVGLCAAEAETQVAPRSGIKAILLKPDQAKPRRLRQLPKEGFNSVVLYLDDSASEEENTVSAKRILDAGLGLHYWIEIARNPGLADAKPEWMASLQTHPEWRRHFPKFPKESANQVVKNYPWVPVLYAETFDVHLERVRVLLENLPIARSVFLNDLQGAPSACGCGNSFCRWTTDYGPITTAQRLPADAAAQFLARVRQIVPSTEVIPVWTTECAEEDGAKDGACAGVSCFVGACWKEYAAQLAPVAEASPQIGVLLPLRDFPGKEPRDQVGEWQSKALASFAEIVPKRDGPVITPNRLVCVVQGWDVSAEQQKAQIQRALAAGAGGYVVAATRIDQSWEPRLLNVPENSAGKATHPPHP